MLKFQLETLDGVDDSAKPFYKEAEDGGYVLQVEGAVSQAKYAEVNQKAVDNATESQRRRRTVERVLSSLGIESADQLDDTIADLIEKSKSTKKSDPDQAAVIAQIKDTHKQEVGALQDKLRKVVLGGASAELKAALSAAKFHPEIVDDIASTAMGRVSLDENGEIRIMKADGSAPLAGSGAGGYATFADLAKELAAAKPSFLVDAGKGGGGKSPASGGSGAAKTVTRAEFDAMSHVDRATFAKSGGKVVDG